MRPRPLTKVIHKSPADKATGIALNTGIRVDFPARLKPSTVPGALILKDSNGTIIPGTLKYTQMPLGIYESIYFQPDAVLSANTTYTATLSKSIITLTGDPHNPEKTLDQDEVWSYTTAAARTATLKIGDVLGDGIVAADVDTANNVFSLANIHTFDQDGKFLPTMTVIKSDNEGNILWQKPVADFKFGGSAAGIAVGTDNHPIITGSKVGAIGTDPALGGLDIIVAKLDGASGNLLWTRQIGTADNDEATDIAVDTTNNIYVSGFTIGAFPGKTAGGAADWVVVSLLPDGTDRWVTQSATGADDHARSIGVNSTTNDVFLVGDTFNVQVPVPEPGPVPLPQPVDLDIFVTRLAPSDGVVAATMLFGGAGYQHAIDAVVSIRGVYISIFDFNRPAEGQVLALDATGTTVTWQKYINLGDYTQLHAIDIDAAGGLYIAGSFERKSMEGIISDVFVQKLDSATLGTMVWENKNIPVTSDNDMNHAYPAYADASALVLDSNSNIFIAGTVFNGGLIDGHVNYGMDDGYVLKMNSAGEVQ